MNSKQKKEPENDIDIEAIRGMIGKWRAGPIYAINGESQCGKTTLMVQEMAEYSHKNDRAALLYDTEGGGDFFVESWLPRHQKNGYDKAKILNRTKRNWQKILADHGIKISEPEISKGGKIKVQPADIKDSSPIADFIEKNNIGFVTYDSMSMPMSAFGINQENFPVRSSVQQLWMHKMIDLIDEYDLVVAITNHVTKNPTNPYAKPTAVGGKAIQHNCKVHFYLRRWEAKGLENCRTIRLDRYYDVGKGEKSGNMEITDGGYIDITEDEMEAKRGKK